MSTISYVRASQAFDHRRLEQTNCNGQTQPVQASQQRQSAAEHGIRTGVANPKWRDQVNRHENASTDFGGSKTTVQFRSCRYKIDFKASQANCKATFKATGKVTPNIFFGTSAFLSTFKADNRARAQFYKKAIKAQRFLQSGVFMGELKETLGLLRNPARGLRSLVSVLEKDARKIYKKPRGNSGRSPRLTQTQKVARAKEAIADSWLEFSFGWSPLVADLESACDLLANLANNAHKNFVRVNGSGFEDSHTIIQDSIVQPTAINQSKPFAVRQQGRLDQETTVKYYGNVWLDLPTHTRSRLLTGLGLTLNDTAPTIWELIPWSFFVDYFTNIGDIIEAWSFPKAKIAWVSRVERKVCKQATFWSLDLPATQQWYSGQVYTINSIEVNTGSCISIRKEITRTAVAELSPPILMFELPDMTRQFLNIGALIAARSSRPNGRF